MTPHQTTPSPENIPNNGTEQTQAVPENLAIPSIGSIGGLDYGTKRIGIAVSDYEQKLAASLTVYHPRNERLDAKYFCDLATDYRLAGWVVGLPIFKSGDESPQSLVVRKFGTWLQAATKLPVLYQDERYSSAEAEVRLWQQGLNPSQRQSKVDQIAALVILQAFLDQMPR